MFLFNVWEFQYLDLKVRYPSRSFRSFSCICTASHRRLFKLADALLDLSFGGGLTLLLTLCLQQQRQTGAASVSLDVVFVCFGVLTDDMESRVTQHCHQCYPRRVFSYFAQAKVATSLFLLAHAETRRGGGELDLLRDQSPSHNWGYLPVFWKMI